jgi:hypothetical protein
MSNEPFFRRDGERYFPTAIAHGSWASDSLHGRSVVGLLGFELERRFGDPAFQPTRLTVDLYRMPPARPLEIQARLLRDGRRIRVAEAEWLSGGQSYARATLMLLRTGEAAVNPVWSRGPWDAPAPAEVPASLREWTTGGKWDFKPIDGFVGLAPKRAWLREIREMVEGFPLTPFTRVAAAADVSSPFAQAHPAGGLDYINPDVTTYLHRLPAGEWIGLETADHGDTAGVAVGVCILHDEQGPIGFVGCAGLHMVHP